MLVTAYPAASSDSFLSFHHRHWVCFQEAVRSRLSLLAQYVLDPNFLLHMCLCAYVNKLLGGDFVLSDYRFALVFFLFRSFTDLWKKAAEFWLAGKNFRAVE